MSKWQQIRRRDSLNKAIGIINIADEDPSLRIGSFAIVNLRGKSHKVLQRKIQMSTLFKEL